MISYGTILGWVGELHRYPVKSLAGERLTALAVDERGVVGDRLWSVRDPDGKFGSGKSTRRFRKMDGLLALRASYDGETPVVTFPDGRVLRGDGEEVHEALSGYVGRPVRLAREERTSHFDEGPLHLVSTASLAAVAAVHGHVVDPRRTRANVIIDSAGTPPLPEDALDGRRVAIGDEVVAQVLYAMPRCVMLDLALVDAPADRGLLRTVTALNGGALGVVADVVRGGVVREGDKVVVTR